ncbi:MAG: hypothetical protein NZ530_02680 [Thermodesulfobacteriaceae bacterium]|nr:hypothetical protein [Thermodesulfobacteriaceae bacterium]MCX8041529.1 hypothetical protein [Thermodesulfobacteriaceae bacterium]MDW8135978.1 hypothetical protein [Thermodesulfobacterium sp.]
MSLKEKLWKIEIAIKEENFSQALILYKEISENWKIYEKSLKQNPEDLEKIFKLITYIDKLLEEKKKHLKAQDNLLKVRKKYTQY